MLKRLKKIVETYVRTVVRQIARTINALSRGHISPNAVTLTGLVAHLPIALLIATGHPYWAAGLLVIFGLFDTLDGELARLQKRVSDVGGFLDTVSDRVKELLIYTGLIYFFAQHGQTVNVLVVTMFACGMSLIIPFVKAKGEAIVATHGSKQSYDKLNRRFGGGILSYEIRIFLLIIGLLAGIKILPWIITAIAILATITVIERFIGIMRSIK